MIPAHDVLTTVETRILGFKVRSLMLGDGQEARLSERRAQGDEEREIRMSLLFGNFACAGGRDRYFAAVFVHVLIGSAIN